jgi:hypothetical protein
VLRGALKYFWWSAHQKSLETTDLNFQAEGVTMAKTLLVTHYSCQGHFFINEANDINEKVMMESRFSRRDTQQGLRPQLQRRDEINLRRFRRLSHDCLQPC